MNDTSPPPPPSPPKQPTYPGAGYPEYVTWSFMAISIIVFFYQMHHYGMPGTTGGLTATDLEQGRHLGLLTHQFVHGSTMHLVFNMMTLYYFGPPVVRFCGTIPFVVCYLVGGVAAAYSEIAVQTFTNHPEVVLVGASGAISALFGLWAARMPSFKINLVLFFVIPIRGRLIMIALGWIGFNVALGIASNYYSIGGIAWIAHAGGTVWGLLQGFLFHKRLQLEANPE